MFKPDLNMIFILLTHEKVSMQEYSVNRINEVYIFFNKIFIEKKNINCIYSILWNDVIVCFAAIELVIVLACFCDVSVTLCNVSVTLSM